MARGIGRVDGWRRQDALARVGEDVSGLARHRPRRSRALGGEAAGEKRQGVGVRQMARERELDRALQLLDAHGDLSSRLRAYGE